MAATRIDSDGGANYPAVSGNLNGDTLPDLVTLIFNSGSSTGVYLAALLNVTGQGLTAPVLTEVSFGANDFIIVADVNKDGRDDVVLVHPNSMDVLLSLGDGTFSAPQNVATGISSPIAAAFWDVNHDQKVDVVVVDGQSSQAAYLLGDGAGGFAPAQVTSFPAQVSVGVLADVDADGNLDLVTNNALYPGDGSGGFQAGISFQSNDGQSAGAATSVSVAVGDVNGDGLLDVVTANGYWNSVSVFLNQGGRQLAQDGVSVWSGNQPVALTLADVNWDGKQDLIVTNAAESDLSVFMGNGDGTFVAPRTNVAIGGAPSTRAVLADFNGDGDPDIALADNQESIVMALGFGDGTFQAAATSNVAVPPGSNSLGGALSIASADFNGDGLHDFVVGQSSSSPGLGVIGFLTQSDGTLGQGAVYAPNDALSYVAAGDINQDGKADIVASNSATGGVEVLLGNGDGTFQPPTSILLPGITNGVVITDLNGDGWPDVALAGQNSALYILLNDGAGALTLSATYPLSGTGTELVAADINNDGKPDLCVTMANTSLVAILLNNGNGTFSAAPDYDTTMSGVYGIASGDFDNNGSLDLVITSPSARAIAIVSGNGDGSFNTPQVYPASGVPSPLSPSPGEVAVADVNGDGSPDIVYANSGYSSVAVLLNYGTGVFYGPTEFPVGGGSIAIAIADLNNDTWPEVVTADAHFSGVSVLHNTSGLEPAPNFTVAGNSAALSLAPGGTGITTITLLSGGTFSGSVHLQCQNLPNTLSCAFAPSVLHLEKGLRTSSQLTIAATQASVAVRTSRRGLMALALLPLLGGMFFWRVPRATTKLCLLALLASLLFFCGCQGPAPMHNASQAYTINVTATAWNGTSHSIAMQVTVQQ